MDVRCPKCGEPWDLDSIHERVSELREDLEGDTEHITPTYERVAADFRRRGCAALGETCPTWDEDEPVDAGTGLTASQAAGALYELLGDDMDGAAAMLEDLGF